MLSYFQNGQKSDLAKDIQDNTCHKKQGGGKIIPKKNVFVAIKHQFQFYAF